MPLTETDALHLRRAFALARQTAQQGNRPFGAVLVDARGDVLSEGVNEVHALGDITAHAETVALRAVSAPLLAGATMYASGEPCAMCSAAMALGGIARVVFGLPSPRIRAASAAGTRAISLRAAQVLGHASEPIEVVGPVLEEEAWEAFAPPPESD